MLIGRIAGKTTRQNVCHGVGAVDQRGLAQRRVDRLEAGEVEHHHVAGLPPARLDQQRPQVEVRVAEPVDQVVVAGCGRSPC